jgi:hypothetical protein
MEPPRPHRDHTGSASYADPSPQLVGCDIAGRERVRVDIGAHRRLRVPEPLGQDLRRQAVVMPDRRPPVSQFLGGEVRDLREATEREASDRQISAKRGHQAELSTQDRIGGMSAPMTATSSLRPSARFDRSRSPQRFVCSVCASLGLPSCASSRTTFVGSRTRGKLWLRLDSCWAAEWSAASDVRKRR